MLLHEWVMENLGPLTINQILDYRVFIIFGGTPAHIIRLDSSFGPIHALIQVAQYGHIPINRAENLYQRFANRAHLHSFLDGIVVR